MGFTVGLILLSLLQKLRYRFSLGGFQLHTVYGHFARHLFDLHAPYMVVSMSKNHVKIIYYMYHYILFSTIFIAI